MLNTRQWLVAIMASLFVHGALFVAWPSLEGAREPGEQGVEIGLGLLGDLGDAAEEPAQEDEPLMEEAEPPPEPRPEPPPEPEPPPDPPMAPEPETTPEPVQLPVAPPSTRTTGPTVASPRVASVEAPKAPEATRRSTPRPIGQVAGASSPAAGGKAGLRRGYAALLGAHLNRHKSYPISARRQGREGTVTLRLVVNRTGRALDARIVRNADFPEFDEAALSMLARAQPLPPFPDGMSETELVVMVPVSFELDKSD